MKRRKRRALSLVLAAAMFMTLLLAFSPASGAANVILIGDADGSGAVTKDDVEVLSRYIAGWEGYADKVDMDAADVSRDGKVTKADATILARYVAGWDGYDMYIGTLYIKNPLTIVKEPLDVEMNAQSAVLSITVSGEFDSIVYEWQKKTASGWRDASTLNNDDATYTVNNSALQIISKNGTEGFGEYRCVVSAFYKGSLVSQVTSRTATVDPQAEPMEALLDLGTPAGRKYFYFYHTIHGTGETDPKTGRKIAEETNARIFKTYGSEERFEQATKWLVCEPVFLGPYGDEKGLVAFRINEGPLAGGGDYGGEAFKDMNGAYLKNENGEYVTKEVLVQGNYFKCSIQSVSGGKGPYTYTWYLSKDRFGNDFQPLIEGYNCMGQGTESIRVWPFERGKGMDEPYFMGFLCCRVTDSKGRTTNACYYQYNYGSLNIVRNYQMMYAFDENSAWMKNADEHLDGKHQDHDSGANSDLRCLQYTFSINPAKDNMGIGRWW